MFALTPTRRSTFTPSDSAFVPPGVGKDFSGRFLLCKGDSVSFCSRSSPSAVICQCFWRLSGYHTATTRSAKQSDWSLILTSIWNLSPALFDSLISTATIIKQEALMDDLRDKERLSMWPRNHKRRKKSPIKVHAWWRCIISASASQTHNHSFSLSFSNACEKQNKSDLLVDYERWGASFGKETEFCICENRIVAKSYLLKLNPREKWIFFVLPFRQHRGCPLGGINKSVI